MQKGRGGITTTTQRDNAAHVLIMRTCGQGVRWGAIGGGEVVPKMGTTLHRARAQGFCVVPIPSILLILSKMFSVGSGRQLAVGVLAEAFFGVGPYVWGNALLDAFDLVAGGFEPGDGPGA